MDILLHGSLLYVIGKNISKVLKKIVHHQVENGNAVFVMCLPAEANIKTKFPERVDHS